MAFLSETRPHLRSSSMTRHPPASYTLVLQNESPGTAAEVDPSTLCAAHKRLYNKITWRLLPIFMTMLMLNWLDRSCLAFASIQMTQELHFSAEVYGLASGFFFLSYCLLQVPANYVCMHIGVQRWFSTIMVLFGLTAASFAAVRRPWQLYLLRLLLGAAEAGSFPGVWYAISLWFPPDRIAFPFSLMGTSVAISQIIAAPLAAALLKLDGVLGLAGWQWVFVGEGLPSVILGLSLPWLLPDGPHVLDGAHKSWLGPEELQLLKADYAAKVSDLKNPFSESQTGDHKLDPSQPAAGGAAGPLQLLLHVLRVWQVWYLAFCNILKDIANVGLMMWMPVMVQALLSGADPLQLAGNKGGTTGGAQEGSADSNTGVTAVLLSAIPFTCAAAAITYSGHHAQRTGRPLWHIIVPCFIGGFAFMSFHWVVVWNGVLGFCCLVITSSCAFAASPHAPAVVAKLTVGPASVIALPCYNSVGMLGGFAGPSIMGFFVQHLGGFSAATAVMGGCMVLSGLLVLLLQRIMTTDSHTRGIISGKAPLAAAVYGSALAADAADGYEVVYTKSGSSITRNRGSETETELARLVGDDLGVSAPAVVPAAGLRGSLVHKD